MSTYDHSEIKPSEWVKRHARIIKPQGSVLDVAAGNGRNARWLAEQGFTIQAVDRDEVALASMQGVANITTHVADLENAPWPYVGLQFDAIIVCRYLFRPLFAQLMESLASEGVLIYETFMQGHEALGRPKNPQFLLFPSELLKVFVPPLHPVAFEQGFDSFQHAIVQRACLVKTAKTHLVLT